MGRRVSSLTRGESYICWIRRAALVRKADELSSNTRSVAWGSLRPSHYVVCIFQPCDSLCSFYSPYCFFCLQIRLSLLRIYSLLRSFQEESSMTIKYSIIVPAYKECGNLEPLTKQVFDALAGDGFVRDEIEIIIVDDNSSDGSVEVVEKLQREGYGVRIEVRTKERGLSSAVIHGISISKGDLILVMDADLQHPPKTVPHLFRALQRPGVEFVCGTRYGAGVKIDKDWPMHRRFISWGARLLARPLTPLTDPMSGFFGLRLDVFQRGRGNVSPIGYKIALELFVKCRVKKYEEIGFNFATRTVGESKLTGKVIIHYLEHLKCLYLHVYGAAVIVMVPVVLVIIFWLLCV
uniref:Dolichol-phosphate mannosyltransferase subunit 1 n=1 Tax=Trypanosoma congolense (strain IL3000) TaxID=1068625 RepID=G0UW53_TRYCI|nr:putative dolichyl-phosphate beta-D-mannosyltransferase precursor [Trypanosoma congolense IL3000]